MRSFAHMTKSGPELDYYDVQTSAFGRQLASTFMAARNDHSREIEKELERVETPASRAARRLLSAAADLEPGLYALADETSPVAAEDFRNGGELEGMSFLVAQRTLARPTQPDEIALAKFLALTYSRSPKHEAAATDTARAYGSALLQTWRSMRIPVTPSAIAPITEAIETARWFGLRHSGELAELLRSRNWWLAKARPRSSFVIGDSPVVSAVAIGHDAGWQPLAGDQFGILAFPLSPAVALLISGPILPVAIDPTDIVPWINRTTLRWADRYVAGHDRTAIEVVLTEVLEPVDKVVFPADPERWVRQGVGAAVHIVIDAYMNEQLVARDLYRPVCRSTPPTVVWATKRVHAL